jgi:uncharacterized surface protein with fasciclin (FAS1) repeats
MKKLYKSCLLALVVFLALNSSAYAIVIDSSAENNEVAAPTGQNIVEIMEGNADLSTFMQAVTAADLKKTLEGAGPFTIFAPSNEAFAELPPDVFQEMLKKGHKSKLAVILKDHMVNGLLLTTQANTSNLHSLGGKPLHLEVRGSQVTVNDANIVQADLAGSNGVVQVIDKVLFTE